jgi:hypothetical protein
VYWHHLLAALPDPHYAEGDAAAAAEAGFYAMRVGSDGLLDADCVVHADWQNRGADARWLDQHGRVITVRLGLHSDSKQILVLCRLHHG